MLGSSAHNLQGLEIYKNRPIIHDAGDLLWDYLRRGPEPGGLFTLTLSRAGVTEVRFLPVLQQSGRALPVTGDAARSVIERFAQQCADLGASLELCPDCARVTLSPPRRHTPPPAGKALEPPHPGLAPKPLAIPLSEWFIEAVPEHARMEPVKLGPLTLRGLYVPPSCRSMRKRQLLWVETYWSLEERIPESLLLSLEARPVSGAFPPFGQSMWHEPCDWMWPTSRWEPGVIYKDVAALRPPPPNRLASAELALICEVRDGNTSLGVYESPDPLFVVLPSKR